MKSHGRAAESGQREPSESTETQRDGDICLETGLYVWEVGVAKNCLAFFSGSVHANMVKWGIETDQSPKPGSHPSSHGLQKPKVKCLLPLQVQMCAKTLYFLRLFCFQASVSSSR